MTVCGSGGDQKSSKKRDILYRRPFIENELSVEGYSVSLISTCEI